MPKGVFKKSEEHKLKIKETRKRLFKEGKLAPWNKGKICPQLAGENNGFWGKKHPKELQEQISAKLRGKGRPMTEETKLKLSIAHKGKKKGIKLSEEHKRKIGIACRGEKSANWKGGVTPFRSFLRSCYEYKTWRKEVFKRDNYECVFGGKEHGNNLQADHIKHFYKILDQHNIKTYEEAQKCNELWSVENGRTLCFKCHRKITNLSVKDWAGGENNYKRKIK